MNLHSKFLIHWTDRKFLEIEDVDERRKKYVKRLRDTCKNGFWMNKGRETIYGVKGKDGKSSCVEADIARVCFSEIRLSQANHHAGKFGELGIGVDRDFILRREGNPILYVQNGSKGHVVQNIAAVQSSAEKRCEEAKLRGNKDEAKFFAESIRDPIRHVMGYLKAMSKEPDSKELDCYEEMEWRVVDVERLHGDYIVEDKNAPEVYRLRLSAPDIRIIIFPDDVTRTQVRDDKFLDAFFKGGWPSSVTLDECMNL